MVEKVKKNYVGYTDKITNSNRINFQQFTDSLEKLSAKANEYECLSICRNWLDFFKDKHMNFGMDFEKLSADSVKNFFSKEEKTTWTENKFKLYLKQNKNKLDNIEGIWHFGIYEVGIFNNPSKRNKEFIAFVIKADGSRWMPQQVKFKLHKINNQYKTIFFRGGDHSINSPKLIKQNDTLDFGFFGKWHKGANPNNQTAKKEIKDLSPKFRLIDDETGIFEMPSFESMDYIAIADSTIKSNETTLKKIKHLIVDLRDNSGGTVLIFKNLLPYLYTNPILTEGGNVLATSDNIKEGYSTEYPQISDSLKNVFKEDLAKLKAHQGELFNLYPVDTIKFEKVLSNPQQFSFLVNQNTGSAAELFLLQAKQSKKVTVFGTNTAGAIDYTEFVTSDMPCPFFTLWYPACKSLRLPDNPLDNIGIAPDVKIQMVQKIG